MLRMDEHDNNDRLCCEVLLRNAWKRKAGCDIPLVIDVLAAIGMERNIELDVSDCLYRIVQRAPALQYMLNVMAKQTFTCCTCHRENISFQNCGAGGISDMPILAERTQIFTEIWVSLLISTSDSVESCQYCQQLAPACWITNTIESLSRLLVLHIPRHSFTDGGARFFSHRLRFPQSFLPLPATQPDLRVHLIGAIAHKGTTETGHHVAFVRPVSSGSWYKCDDNRVTLVKWKDVSSIHASLLFYARPYQCNDNMFIEYVNSVKMMHAYIQTYRDAIIYTNRHTDVNTSKIHTNMHTYINETRHKNITVKYKRTDMQKKTRLCMKYVFEL